MPYENTEVNTYTAAAYFNSVNNLICIYSLSDDETFNLWVNLNFIFATYAKQN